MTSFFIFEITYFHVCSLKDPCNFSMQPLPLYKSCLFSIYLNDDIVVTEKPNAQLLFLSELLLRQSNIQNLHKY